MALDLVLAVILLAVSGVMAVGAVRGGSHGGWRSLRWAASAAAFADALLVALGLLT